MCDLTKRSDIAVPEGGYRNTGAGTANFDSDEPRKTQALGGGIAGAAAERLAPKRSPQAHQREQHVRQLLMQKQEQRHMLDNDIRELRRLLDLSSRYDLEELVDYIQLVTKHGV